MASRQNSRAKQAAVAALACAIALIWLMSSSSSSELGLRRSRVMLEGPNQVHDFELNFYPQHTNSTVTLPSVKRREEFLGESTTAYQAIYDEVWTKAKYPSQSCWGCRYGWRLVSMLDFTTVLDAGTGNGMMVREMRRRGKEAYGIELSPSVLEKDAPDMLKAGWVEQGTLTNLPYADNQFDLVTSWDVLEHIQRSEADVVVSELVRVAKRHIIFSVSLKSHDNDKLHTLLRPREWWTELFGKHGAVPDRALIWALQEKDSFESKEYSDCRWEGDDQDGGKFQVCRVPSVWLVGKPGQKAGLRNHRCITPANGELEPWIFSFTVEK